MWKSTIRGAFLVILLLASIPNANAATIFATRTFDRTVSIYYGTWTVFEAGNPTPIASHNLLELTDLLVDVLRLQIQTDLSVAPIVRNGVIAWVDPEPDAVNWVFASPVGLDAIGNFNASIASFGGAITFDTGFVPTGTRSYILQTSESVEIAPVEVGDSDNPELFGELGDEAHITNNAVGEILLYERNGTVTLRSVPEPGSGLLAGIGLAMLAGFCARKNKPLRVRGW